MPRLLLLAIPVLAAAGAGLGLVARPSDPPPVVIEASATPAPSAPTFVIVDVGGAVVRPGVVHLPAGARVIDALAAVGGATPDADLSALNRAAPLRDGSRVYVPRVGETPPAGSVGTDAQGKIDLNHASETDLETLPGIGPTIAQKIVRSREAQPFTRVEELQTRGIVSARVFADIKGLVTTR